MFVRLLRLPRGGARRVRLRPALQTVLHGAAPIAPATKRAMIEWWGPKLVEYWGGTEGGVNTLIDSAEWLATPGQRRRRSLPGFDVFADRRSRAGACPKDEVGTLYCTSGGHTAPLRLSRRSGEDGGGLPRRPHLHARRHGLGRRADGYVHLADRKSNMIISGGVNIYPAEIEAALIQHEAIADVGVFGVPDDEWGEQVKAAVQLAPGFEPERGDHRGAPRLRPREARGLQGAALDRLRAGAPARYDRQALRPAPARSVLGRARAARSSGAPRVGRPAPRRAGYEAAGRAPSGPRTDAVVAKLDGDRASSSSPVQGPGHADTVLDLEQRAVASRRRRCVPSSFRNSSGAQSSGRTPVRTAVDVDAQHVPPEAQGDRAHAGRRSRRLTSNPPALRRRARRPGGTAPPSPFRAGPPCASVLGLRNDRVRDVGVGALPETVGLERASRACPGTGPRSARPSSAPPSPGYIPVPYLSCSMMTSRLLPVPRSCPCTQLALVAAEVGHGRAVEGRIEHVLVDVGVLAAIDLRRGRHARRPLRPDRVDTDAVAPELERPGECHGGDRPLRGGVVRLSEVPEGGARRSCSR